MSKLIEDSVIEYTLSALYQFLGKKLVISPKDRAPVDFLYTDAGKKNAVEVKGDKLQISSIRRILQRVQQKKKKIDSFIIVTPKAPTKKRLSEAQNIAKDFFPEFQWFGFEEYTELLTGLSIKTPQDVSKMQLAAITSNIEYYDVNLIGSEIDSKSRSKKLINLIGSINSGKEVVDSEQIALQRQFQYSIVSDYKSSKRNLNHYFNIGNVTRGVSIVLTDIKDFSEIVSSAYPDDLNEVMGKYYREARKLVFEYGGVLDKFIGDAVLAIFNYPKNSKESLANSIRFSVNLIDLGKSIFEELQQNMDQLIPTGTRVGIANGEVYPLNIGEKDPDLSFIGDKINLAARLEKNCPVNGILISNILKSKLLKKNPKFVEDLDPIQKKIKPEDAKGQKRTITAWEISPETVKNISKTL